MSTPSGKIPHLVDLATHVARQARQSRPAEPDPPLESGNDSQSLSAYAPKPADERAAARLRVLAQDDADDVVSAYAPKRARLSQSGANSETDSPASPPPGPKELPTAAPPQDASANGRIEDAPRLAPEPASGSSPDFAETPDNKPRPIDRPPPAAEQASGKRLVKPVPIRSLPPREAADNESRKQRSGEIQRRTIADREIERIEAILRQLQRRELAATRLPRGPNLPAPDPSGSALSRHAKMLDTFGRQHSLEPTRLPPPPLQPTQNLHVILGATIACVGVALACYYFVSAPPSQPVLKSQTASLPPSSAAMISAPQTASSRGPRLDSEPEWAPRTTGAQTDLAPAGKLNSRDTPPDALIASQRPASAKLQSVPEPTAPPSSSNAGRGLPPEEIRLLVEQGEKFISDGDIVTARVIFERAAKAGDAAAALALAAAYDPIVLARLGVLGIDTDVEKARIWYQKAQSLGATQAVDRLEALARR